MSGEIAKRGLAQKLAGALAESPLFGKARRIWEANSKDWYYPLSKFGKLYTGVYLILQDYSKGLFPPKFEDRETTYAGEVNYKATLPGVTTEQTTNASKPFSNAHVSHVYLPQYLRVVAMLEQYGIKPPARLLELGCGCGWMTEFLAICGYNVVGTTIAPDDIEVAERRKGAVRCKRIDSEIEFELAPMESVNSIKLLRDGFDCVFIYEALHHAYSWKEALAASYKSLKPGGWFLIANEPKFLHTFMSYRIAKLSNTHEIGMSASAIARHLKAVGFGRVDVLSPKWFGMKGAICIMAQRPK